MFLDNEIFLDPPIFNFIFNKKKLFLMVKSWGDFSLEVGGILPRISYKLHWTYEEIHCRGEPYLFSGLRDRYTKINRQIDILLLFY